MFHFRKISSNLIRRQISASKPLKLYTHVPVRTQHFLALNLSLSRFNLSSIPPKPVKTSITDQLKETPAEKEKQKDSWTNIHKYSGDERESILEEVTQEHRSQNTKRTNKYGVPCFVGFMVATGIWWFGFYDITEEQEQESYTDRPAIAWKNFLKNIDEMVEGTDDEQLLPPKNIPPPGYISLEPNYCLVIEPIKCLITPEYDLKNGWRMKKRQGFKRFVDALQWDRQTGKHNDFEVIQWTYKPMLDFQETAGLLANSGLSAMPLYREACQYIPNFKSLGKDGSWLPKPYYKKPIGRLNRDLSKLIIIDVDERTFEDYPENGLIIPEAPLDPHQNDMVLNDLVTFLMTIQNDQVDDVRPIIKYYSQFGDKWLDKFRENQQQTQEEEIQTEEEIQANLQRARMQSFSRNAGSWFKR